ncbi:U11/U12 small nuclear ribonucleoprotein 35 kDa protein-like [Epargyreus clarus]|uniref:U11/U12 small nuclear ribonucleoprotein 35 kDa protein-like n=1 Tax=Epargyreus clarus TaxID=520877 RepID=UPI003C2DC6D2
MTHEKNRDYETYADETYDPIKVGSIDGTDTEPHDRGVVRALLAAYAPNKLVRGEPAHTVFVTRLNPRTTEETIKREFSRCGKIVSCRVVKDIVTGKSKRYAFVEFDSSNSMERAHSFMHKEVIDGAQILVEKEAERLVQGWRPRRLGGGFGGRRESGQLRFGCRERPFRRPFMTSIKQETDKIKRDMF